MSNLKHSKYIFTSMCRGIYKRDTYPHLVNVIPFNKSFKYIDLLAASITYSLVVSYNDRYDYHWSLIKRAICNGDRDSKIYISLVFNKPTTLSHLRVTYINSIDDLNLYPSLKERVLSNLLQIIRD